MSVTFVHCVQTAEDIETISFAYDSPVSLPGCFKIWITSVSHFLPRCSSKVTNAVDLSVSDIRRHHDKLRPNG